MHENAVAATASKLVALASKVSKPTNASDQIIVAQIRDASNASRYHTITIGDYEEYSHIIDSLLPKYKWGEQFSYDFVQDRINVILSKLVTSNDRQALAEQEIRALADEVESYDCE